MAEPPENSVHPKTAKAWRTWLVKNHETSTGVWLISFKKETGLARFDYDDAVMEALCFGWIDSKPAKLDDQRSMLWFSPRKPKTGWSKVNKQRIARLLQAGKLAPAGLAKIEAAKLDGSWSKLDEVEELVIPPDLAAELAKYPLATTHFQAFPKSAKRGILEWILNAKQPATRAKRIAETAQLANQNIRANQWRPGTSK
jgi:uncharacterized protein YdeI (YjbR/CyaY-like superfamily)